MACIRKVLGSMIVALLAFSVVLAAPAGADEGGDEAAFLASLNGLRSSKGLGTLGVSSELTAVARVWSASMAAAGTISHNPSLAAQGPANWVRLGENVGVGSDVPGLHAAFVASPSHYKNMIDGSFDSVGIGVVRDGAGQIFVTVNYMKTGTAAPVAVQATARPTPAPAPAPAPAAVSAPSPAPARAPAPAPAAAPAPAPAPVPAPVAAPAPVEPVAEPAPGPVAAPAPEPVAAPAVAPVTSPDSRRAMVTSSSAAASGQSADTAIVLVGVGLLLTLAASALVLPRRAPKAAALARR